MPNRLRLISADEIEHGLRILSHEERCCALERVCKICIDLANVRNSLIDEILKNLRIHRIYKVFHLFAELKEIRDNIDNSYLSKLENLPPNQPYSDDLVTEFRAARAISALLYACDACANGSLDAACESMYEAMQVFGDQGEIKRIIKT